MGIIEMKGVVCMRYGMIGYGNLGKAFAQGLAEMDFFSIHQLVIYAKSEATRERAREDGFTTMESVKALVDHAETVILALNSKGLEELIAEGLHTRNKTVISFLAGRTLAQLEEELGTDRIARVIPNIAMAKGASVSSISYSASFDEKMEVEDLFKTIGTTIVTDEEGLDKITVLSSSGIAFAAKLIDGLRKKGEAYGFSEEESLEIAKGTFLGALSLMDVMTAEELMNKVATKGGATYEGLVSYDEDDVDGITAKAIDRCYEKIMRFKEGKDLH